MNMIYFIIGLATIEVCKSYVLLQVRKGDNQSNVDALIHKVIPAEKFQKFADTARKQFQDYRQIKIKSKPNDKELESIVFAIKTNADVNGGVNEATSSNSKVAKLLKDIKKTVIDMIKPKTSNPKFRREMEKYNLTTKNTKIKNDELKDSIDNKVIMASLGKQGDLSCVNVKTKNRKKKNIRSFEKAVETSEGELGDFLPKTKNIFENFFDNTKKEATKIKDKTVNIFNEGAGKTKRFFTKMKDRVGNFFGNIKKDIKNKELLKSQDHPKIIYQNNTSIPLSVNSIKIASIGDERLDKRMRETYRLMEWSAKYVYNEWKRGAREYLTKKNLKKLASLFN